MKICPQCGYKVDDNALKCPRCSKLLLEFLKCNGNCFKCRKDCNLKK